MEHVGYTEHPNLRSPLMLMAFSGWPDAAEGATGALKYLVRKLPAQQFASIDPEEFYVFTRVRPVSQTNTQGQREVTWPTNEFYYYDAGVGQQNLLIFIGVEPNLKWRAYSNAIAEVLQEQGVRQVVIMGTLLDTVPHTRAIRITGGSSDPSLQEKLDGMEVRSSTYEGPIGITTAVSQALLSHDIASGSIWGHAPHYTQANHYPKISLALLEKLQEMLDWHLDLDQLRSTEASFQQEFQDAVENEDELMTYVARLERR